MFWWHGYDSKQQAIIHRHLCLSPRMVISLLLATRLYGVSPQKLRIAQSTVKASSDFFVKVLHTPEAWTKEARGLLGENMDLYLVDWNTEICLQSMELNTDSRLPGVVADYWPSDHRFVYKPGAFSTTGDHSPRPFVYKLYSFLFLFICCPVYINYWKVLA